MKKTNDRINTDYEIMIVGGGPAGISTWLHLNKFAPELAEKTVLIEKEKYPRDKLCGGALLGFGSEILKRLNINLNIPTIPIHSFEYRCGEELFSYKQKNMVQIIRRIEFDHGIAKTAIERGLHLNENEIFLDYSHVSNHLKVKTNKGTYTVKALVGADGATSPVRTKMNLSVRPRFSPAIEVFTPVNPHYDPEFTKNSALIDFTPIKEGLQGYVWHFPCLKNGKPYMNHGICDVHINTQLPRPDLKNIFTRSLHERNIDSRPSSWSGAPVPWFAEKTSLSQSHILLAGDAAGIEPLLGSGIHLALLYGGVASKAVQDAFIQNDFSFNDYTAQIQSNFVGRTIQQFTFFASEIYHGRMNALDAMKRIVVMK